METMSIRARRGASGLILALAFGACAAKAPAPPATAANSNNTGTGTRSPAAPATVASAGGEQASCELESVYYGFDSSDLDSQAKEVLARNQKCAQQKGATGLRLVGMTDPRGTEEYNLALGDRRAQNAARYLAALGTAQPEATSVGAEMAKGSDEESWARDRRTDLQLK